MGLSPAIGKPLYEGKTRWIDVFAIRPHSPFKRPFYPQNTHFFDSILAVALTTAATIDARNRNVGPLIRSERKEKAGQSKTPECDARPPVC